MASIEQPRSKSKGKSKEKSKSTSKSKSKSRQAEAAATAQSINIPSTSSQQQQSPIATSQSGGAGATATSPSVISQHSVSQQSQTASYESVYTDEEEKLSEWVHSLSYCVLLPFPSLFSLVYKLDHIAASHSPTARMWYHRYASLIWEGKRQEKLQYVYRAMTNCTSLHC